MTPDKPYEFAHPQFDRENWEAWDDFIRENGYVRPSGLNFTRYRDGNTSEHA
jgi:hypothetical protein